VGPGEFVAIDRIQHLLAARLGAPPEGETWVGDDAAVVQAPGGPLLLAADLVVAGVHADLDLEDLDDLGWKSLTVNVSDIAAMGGVPGHALVTVAGPPDTDLGLLYAGLAEASDCWRCPIVGGDLSNGPVVVVSVAVTGSMPEGRAPLLRSGAREGDLVFVTGPLGAAAAGLRALREGRDDAAAQALAARHRRPEARVAEGLAALAGGASAMIDISDGLAADLGHLARASRVGVDLDHIPVAEGAMEAEALAGGEDYELVFTAPHPEAVARSFDAAGLARPPLLGRCTSRAGQLRLGGQPLEASGWEHEWRWGD
jgi:thiamine-monophosphate kinase